MNEEVSELILNQRIRNRIIEYLSLVSQPSQLREYQENVSVSVLNEVIQQWQDWVDIDNTSVYEQFTRPPFTSEEQVAILEYNEIWDKVIDNIPMEVNDIYQFIKTDDYKALSETAKSAYQIFSKRGFLDEEREDQ